MLADDILEELFADDANMQPDKATEIVARHRARQPKRNPRRSRNPIMDRLKTRNGKIVIGAAAAAIAVVGVFAFRRKANAKALASTTEATVTSQGGTVIIDPSTEPNGPKPTKKAYLPAELLAGGVPLEPGWKTVAWYTYPEDQIWIRIDEYGDAIFKEDEEAFTIDHKATMIGRWRWVVIAGEATWLATGELNGTYKLARNRIYWRYDRESAEDTMRWAAAMEAMRWIDAAYGLR